MKRFVPILLICLLLLALVGCSGSADWKESDDYAYAETAAPAAGLYEGYAAEEAYEPTEASASGSSPVAEGQKLIRRVYLTAETEDYYAFMDQLSATVASLGGYMEQVEARTSGSQPSASLTVRVPADRLDALTAQVDGYSNITYRSESQQNVTLQYADTESRILALRTEQTRLLELLEQAEDLEQVLMIEDRLTEVRYQLESNESSLRALANQVDYATVTLDVRQVEVFTPVEQKGYWENAGSGFVGSLESIGNFFKNLLSGLIIGLPYLILLIVLPLVIVLLILRAHKRKKAAAKTPAATPADFVTFSGTPVDPTAAQDLTNGENML